MYTTRLLLFTALAIVAAAAVFGNVAVALRYALLRKRGSLVPIVGGLAGSAAMLFAPWPGLATIAWLPLVADIGTVPLLAMTLVAWWRRRRVR
jgi:hypothetical protein